MVLTCPKCGHQICDEDAIFCPFCSNMLKTKPPRQTDFPIAGGVLMIIAASICIITAMVASLIFLTTYQSPYYYGWGGRGYYMPRYEDLLAGTVGIVAFVYGLAAGILSLKRKKFVHCLAGGLLMVFEGFLIVFAFAQQWSASWIIGTLFGVPIILLSAPALLLVSMSKEEFK